MNRMGACFDRLRCEVFQNLFLSPMNTGFLGSAVATVLTVYGIETTSLKDKVILDFLLQQYLPFTVLKPNKDSTLFLTLALQQYLPFTVLKLNKINLKMSSCTVATVLTVYGIETYPLWNNKL